MTSLSLVLCAGSGVVFTHAFGSVGVSHRAARSSDTRYSTSYLTEADEVRVLVHRMMAARSRQVSRSHERSPWVSLGTQDVTEYCWTGHHTASGKWPVQGMVATLDRGIPFGSVVLIEGHYYTVEDRIGWGSDFDIYAGKGAACERKAAIWGRKTLSVKTRLP